jgi:hypothetical protein
MVPAASVALVALNRDVIQAGGAPLRLLDVWRDPNIQADARAKYDRWVAAGKPEPGTRAFDSRTMKAAYVARPGESNHGWGGAIDFDDGALEFPGTGRGTDAALAVFWQLAAEHGFTPIIREPIIAQSESWHFDYLGTLSAVRDLGNSHGVGGYGLVATVGSILAGTAPISWRRSQERYVQARLVIGGFWPGTIDGYLGNKTKAAVAEAGVKVKANAPTSTVIAALNDAGIGLAEIAGMNGA